MAKISFIGGGVMAEAIISRIISKRIVAANEITVGEIYEERRLMLSKKYEISTTSDNSKAIKDSDLILLSVKPQDLLNVIEGLKSRVKLSATVISIAPGISLNYIKDNLNHNKIIRVMPNTPAQIGKGMSVWIATESVDKKTKGLTKKILRALGEEIYVTNEKLVEMATALSASGPAYVFLFIEAMIDAGVKLGLPRDSARTMVLQTILGSIELLKKTDQHPAILKDLVTSPGGTTAAALVELEKGKFKATIIQAVIAAHEKSNSIMKENNQ